MSGTIAIGIASSGAASSTTTRVWSCAFAPYASHHARWKPHRENGVAQGDASASVSQVAGGIVSNGWRMARSGRGPVDSVLVRVRAPGAIGVIASAGAPGHGGSSSEMVAWVTIGRISPWRPGSDGTTSPVARGTRLIASAMTLAACHRPDPTSSNRSQPRRHYRVPQIETDRHSRAGPELVFPLDTPCLAAGSSPWRSQAARTAWLRNHPPLDALQSPPLICHRHLCERHV